MSMSDVVDEGVVQERRAETRGMVKGAGIVIMINIVVFFAIVVCDPKGSQPATNEFPFDASTNSPSAELQIEDDGRGEDIRTDTVRDNGTGLVYIKLKRFGMEPVLLSDNLVLDRDKRVETLMGLMDQWRHMNPRKKILNWNFVPVGGENCSPAGVCMMYEILPGVE